MNEEKEDLLTNCTVRNTLHTHALVKLLIKKELITESEIDHEYALVKMEFENEDSAKLN